jgi:hypothetical protein
MEDVNCTTPVALFFYQRSESTRKVIEWINSARPPSVYLITDQAPPDGDRDAVERCRETVDEFEWHQDIEFRCDYADTHHGLHQRFVSGLAWLFDNESEAIILEDDGVPNASFFEFCDAMLSKYRTDERV